MSEPSVHDLLDRLSETVEQARAMPMSSSCIVHRVEVLELLDDVRRALPAQIHRADQVVTDADAVLERARVRAEEVLAQARARAEEMVSHQAVVAAASSKAQRLVADAEAEAARLLAEADDYCDRRLADFEIDLDRIGQQVRRGREKLRARGADGGEPAPG